LQAVFPDPCLQRKSGFFSNTEKRQDGVTLTSGQMQAELSESSRHKRASGHFTGPSGREQGIRLLLSWKLYRIFLEL
jgi:hypothetical protein